MVPLQFACEAFEVGKEAVGKGGVVRDEDERSTAIQKVVESAEAAGSHCHGVIDSPIPGAR